MYPAQNHASLGPTVAVPGTSAQEPRKCVTRPRSMRIIESEIGESEVHSGGVRRLPQHWIRAAVAKNQLQYIQCGHSI